MIGCDVCGIDVTPNRDGECPICTSRLTDPQEAPDGQ